MFKNNRMITFVPKKGATIEGIVADMMRLIRIHRKSIVVALHFGAPFGGVFAGDYVGESTLIGRFFDSPYCCCVVSHDTAGNIVMKAQLRGNRKVYYKDLFVPVSGMTFVPCMDELYRNDVLRPDSLKTYPYTYRSMGTYIPKTHETPEDIAKQLAEFAYRYRRLFVAVHEKVVMASYPFDGNMEETDLVVRRFYESPLFKKPPG